MRRIHVISFLLFATIFEKVPAQSKYQWQTISSGGYNYKVIPADPMKTRFYTLKNGLTVILTVNKKEPRISCAIPVRAGLPVAQCLGVHARD